MRHKPIVAGIDGSSAADVAIKWATVEAASLRTQLRLIHAITPDSSTSQAGDIINRAVTLARGLGPGVALDPRIETGSPSTILVKSSGDAELVVIGYDGSSASRTALDFGLGYARRHDLAVRVVAAQPPGTDLHRITAAELQDAVHSRGGHDAELIQITGHPAEHLLRLSADANLIVLGARGRGGFAGMLIGSVSQTVLHHADCPVAIIPAAAIGG